MTTQFPTALDDYANVPQNQQVAVRHRQRHQDVEDAVEAIERKVGVDNSTDQTSLEYRVSLLEGNPSGFGLDSSLVRYDPPFLGSTERNAESRLSDFPTAKDFNAAGDGVTNDQTAIADAYAATNGLYFPEGVYPITSKPSGFTTKQRLGTGIVRTPSGDIYPDTDVLRHSPNMDIGDFKITLTRNNANLNTDPAARGFYFSQDYSSSLAGAGQLFGYTANVKRVGGNRRVVPAQFNGYGLTGTADSVWGIATEAWNGDATTAGGGSTPLIGAEHAVISQYDGNTAPLIGTDVVFKNRPDGSAAALAGLGANSYNRASVGLRISSQARGTDTAFCGFRKGIEFTAASLDESLDGRAIGIDLSLVPAARLTAAIKFGTDQPIVAGSRSATVFDGWRYVNDAAPVAGTRIEFVRGIEPGGANQVKAMLDLSNNAAATSVILTFSTTSTTVGATGAASALPANPLGYFVWRLTNGTQVRTPYYNRG